MAVLDLAVLGYQLDSILEVFPNLNDSMMPYQAKTRLSSSQCPFTVPPCFLHWCALVAVLPGALQHLLTWMEQGNSQTPGAEKLIWTHWIISCLSICLSRSWVLPLPQSLMTEQKPSTDFRGQKTCSFLKSLFNTRIVPGIKSEGVVPAEQLSPMDWQWINLPRSVIEWDLTQPDALRDPWCSSQQFILLTEKQTFSKIICGEDCFILRFLMTQRQRVSVGEPVLLQCVGTASWTSIPWCM